MFNQVVYLFGETKANVLVPQVDELLQEHVVPSEQSLAPHMGLVFSAELDVDSIQLFLECHYLFV